MKRRQTMPRQWLIADAPDEGLWCAVRRLASGSGILVLAGFPPAGMRRLRRLARSRGLTIASEPRGAARVHNVRELRAALLARTPLILLSPIRPTASHSEWKPLPPMRAAALARLGGRRLAALGGMDERKFRRVEPLGFQGWAGISAFRT